MYPKPVPLKITAHATKTISHTASLKEKIKNKVLSLAMV